MCVRETEERLLNLDGTYTDIRYVNLSIFMFETFQKVERGESYIL